MGSSEKKFQTFPASSWKVYRRAFSGIEATTRLAACLLRLLRWPPAPLFAEGADLQRAQIVMILFASVGILLMVDKISPIAAEQFWWHFEFWSFRSCERCGLFVFQNPLRPRAFFPPRPGSASIWILDVYPLTKLHRSGLGDEPIARALSFWGWTVDWFYWFIFPKKTS